MYIDRAIDVAKLFIIISKQNKTLKLAHRAKRLRAMTLSVNEIVHI